MVCWLKEGGELGIRNFGVIKRALLGKWLWSFAVEEDSCWRRIVLNKYGKEWEGGDLRWWRSSFITTGKRQKERCEVQPWWALLRGCRKSAIEEVERPRNLKLEVYVNDFMSCLHPFDVNGLICLNQSFRHLCFRHLPWYNSSSTQYVWGCGILFSLTFGVVLCISDIV